MLPILDIKAVKYRICSGTNPWVDFLNVSLNEVRRILTLGKILWTTKRFWLYSSQDELVPIVAYFFNIV